MIDKLLAATLEVTGTKLSDQAVNLMLNRLSRECPEAVKHALSRCAEECRYKVTLADILGRLPDRDNEAPTDPELAWQIALRELWPSTEEQTIVVAEAIFVSFPWGHCIVEDKIGARMAFKAAYPDKLARFGSQIIVVEGTDKASKEATVLEAAKNGKISVNQAMAILPGVAAEQWTQIVEDAQGAGGSMTENAAWRANQGRQRMIEARIYDQSWGRGVGSSRLRRRRYAD